MALHLRLVCLILVSFNWPALAQPTILTQPVTPASVCPGTLLDVPFLVVGTFGSGNVFSVQLSKGGTLTTLPVSLVIGNSATGQFTTTTTLPSGLETGTYQLRVVASNPATVGTVSSTSLFVKTQPTTAPTLAAQAVGNNTSRYTFCQNDTPLSMAALVGPSPDNYRILYDLGTSLTSSSQRTFTAPLITTSTPGKATYNVRYAVIDETKGCNPVAQAGTVSFLETEVKTRPGAPAVSVTNPAYCQNQAAGTLQATVTTAGSELVWYDAAGTPLAGAAPVPPTGQVGTTTYQVAQSLDRCEGTRVSVPVTIKAASALPTTARSRIDLCRGAAAEPLTATGTNLIWTDPSGATSTAAPTPSTLNASKTAEGDLYYVTQTGPTGCPSPRLPIRVVVQAQATLSLSGGANINIGADLPLKLTFSGAGPYRYRLTTSPATATLTGTATKDTTLLLQPDRSLTYQVAEVSNGCGAGLPGNPATATVVVLVPTIRTTTLSAVTACAGGSFTAQFQTTGTFNTGNAFRLQLARTNPDTTKLTYADLVITQQVGNSQLTGALPATLAAGTYLVRVVATNPRVPIIGSPSATTLTVLAPAGATLTTSTSAITQGEGARLTVAFTGDGPWTFTYRDSTTSLGPVQTVTTTTNPYVLEVRPARSTTYRLTGLSNGCSVSSSISGRAVIMVAPLLATEPLASQISVFPVPATSQVTVQIDPALLGNETAMLTLSDAAGRPVLTQLTRQVRTQLPLAEQPSGLYVLQVQVGQRRISRRVIKQ